MADTLGLKGVGDFLADARPKNWREVILLLFPNGSAPLTAFTSQLATESVNDPEYNWWEKAAYFPRYDIGTLGGDGTETDTSIEIEEIGTSTRAEHKFRAGDIIYNETQDEYMRCTSDGVQSTALTVTRDWGGRGTYTATDGDTLMNLGPALSEGASIGSGLQFDPSKKYNYTQIFRHALQFTRTARRTRLRTGDHIKEAKREALEQHSVSMELSFLMGVRNEDTSDTSKVIRSTQGLHEWISTNKGASGTAWYPSDGVVTNSLFDANMRDLFKYGATEKLVLCGAHANMVLNHMAREGVVAQTTPGVELVFGMRLKRIMTSFGDLLVRTHPLLSQHAVWTKWSYFIDLPNIRYRYIDDTQYLKNRGTRGDDAMTDEFLTECGLEVWHEATHGVYKNMDSFAP